MAISADTDEALRRLHTVMTKEAGVDTVLADLVIAKYSLASVADLASFFVGDEYQKGVESDFLLGTAFETTRLQVARLRAAVELCRSELGHALATGKRSSATMDDWGSPLDPAIRIEAEAAIKKKHHLTFDDSAKPAPALFARLFREFRRGCLACMTCAKSGQFPIALWTCMLKESVAAWGEVLSSLLRRNKSWNMLLPFSVFTNSFGSCRCCPMVGLLQAIL